MAGLRARVAQLVAGAAKSVCVIAAGPSDDLLGGDPDVAPAGTAVTGTHYRKAAVDRKD